MTHTISSGLLECYPCIDQLFADVRSASCAIDDGICTRDLRVEATKYRIPSAYYGWAYPFAQKTEGKRTTYHADGLVRMYIGSQCGDLDIIRLYAHELRHIGQFHRGRLIFGHLTSFQLTDAECEADARDFEDLVLLRVS